jgi:hypothetical protein
MTDLRELVCISELYAHLFICNVWRRSLLYISAAASFYNADLNRSRQFLHAAQSKAIAFITELILKINILSIP